MEEAPAVDNCILCDEVLQASLRKVQNKGIQGLIKASRQRKDMKHLELRKYNSINVHESCAKNYPSDKNIKLYLSSVRSGSHTPVTRNSSSSNFDFQEQCLFCEKDASDEFIQKQSRQGSKAPTVCLVNSAIVKDNILKALDNSSDKNSHDLYNRIIATEDLAAVGARYHKKCMQNFYSKLTRSSNEPEERLAIKAAKFIYEHVQANSEECQFSINEILDKFESDSLPLLRTLKKHLYNIFDDDIIIHTTKKYGPILSYRSIGKKLLTDLWYQQKNSDINLERRRVVETAAKIIREDIRTKIYENDTYPAPHCFLDNVNTDIPDTLKIFLDSVIVNDKVRSKKWERKVTALAHCLLTAARPRSFLSSLQIGLAVMLNKKFGSKELLQILNSLGYCASYEESLLFEASVLVEPENLDFSNTYFQFIFDNADHNINTIDGRNTFHAMGGIQTVTPGHSVHLNTRIPRLKKLPSADFLGNFGKISIQNYYKDTPKGLENIVVKNLQDIKPISTEIQIQPADFLWICGRTFNKLSFEGWNGFMESITSDKSFDTSRIIYLPFLNAPPSQYDTIYTVLLQANEKCKAAGQRHCFVTFDQPLYYKAREVLECCKNSLPHPIARLGGFHAAMSFMGSIGYAMSGSGLKEALCEIYAENSVDKILTGHAYSRAVRGHMLAHAALASLIISDLNLAADEMNYLKNILLSIDNEIRNEIKSEIFSNIFDKFSLRLENLKQNGPTAQLWIQYFNNVTLIKQFIEAERSGNWDLHLECIRKMIPFFYSTGHYLYAKSCHLYLQDMYELSEKMDPSEYYKFTKQGYFTVRRSKKFWSGIWTDMTIEQMLMRLMKTQGGLTHGRGITDSVLSKWISTMLAVIDVTQGIQTFCDVSFGTTEQHVDARQSRISRDSEDLIKLSQYFSNREPFARRSDIISISTGIKGDESINCYKAYEIGDNLLQDIVGKTFAQLKFQRKNKILPLSAAVSAIKSDEEVISIDPTLIFQRISLAVEGKEDLKKYFAYELSPYPLSIFDDAGMRKTQKSKLYDTFSSVSEITTANNLFYIIDGGYLLHKVVWYQNDCFDKISERYVQYIQKHYSTNCMVIFDGYPDDETTSTKKAERLRRATRQISREIIFDASTSVCVSQEKFLSNDKNKSRLINMLKEKLQSADIQTMQADEDADTLIINAAIQHSSSENNVVIVGEDIDLLVILSQLNPVNTIYYLKPGKDKTAEKIYTGNSFNYTEIRDLIAFIHAFTGCDTTSAFFKQGKKKLVNILKNNVKLADEVRIFNKVDANRNDLIKSGCKVITAFYGEKAFEKISLNYFRYKCFKKYCQKNSFNLAALPPCESTASEHIFRVYLQVQIWLGNVNNPTEWGWKIGKNGLTPRYSSEPLLPPDFVNLIKCTCTLKCGKRCNCKKHGLACTEYCEHCEEKNCSNLKRATVIASDDANDEDAIDAIEDICSELPEDFSLYVTDDDADNEESIEVDLEPPKKKHKL